MRVLLISANREETEMRVPPLGLACVSAATIAAGHKVEMLDLLLTPDPETAVHEAINRFRPQVIGVSVRNIDDQNMHSPRLLLDQALATVSWCKAVSNSLIIVGGSGFSILPGPVLEYLGADMGIEGEGEAVFPELLHRIERGEKTDDVPGLVLKGNVFAEHRTLVRNMDSLPLPAPGLVAASLKGVPDAVVPIQTRRGCPLNCTYCSTPSIEGKKLRWRSPLAIVNWMAQWVQQGFRSFYFVDNTFNLPAPYALDLCRWILESKLPITWKCILYPGGLNEELAKAMADAGCREVSLGFESGSRAVLRWMKKHYEPKDIRKTSRLLRECGIRQVGFLLLGGPAETRKSVEESLQFAEDLDLEALKLTVGIRIYPRTELARIVQDEGLIVSDSDLLQPRFYIAPKLAEWIDEQVALRARLHPNWII